MCVIILSVSKYNFFFKYWWGLKNIIFRCSPLLNFQCFFLLEMRVVDFSFLIERIVVKMSLFFEKFLYILFSNNDLFNLDKNGSILESCRLKQERVSQTDNSKKRKNPENFIRHFNDLTPSEKHDHISLKINEMFTRGCPL